MENDMAEKPTEKEISDAASVLSRLDPGFLPKEIFFETTRLTVTPIIEVVPVRHSNNRTEVLLMVRPDDDPNWPGMLHTPGTVLRSTDVSHGFKGALNRIYDDELGFRPEKNPIQATVNFHTVTRGAELATVFYLDLGNDTTPRGHWFDAHNLPDSIVDTQIEFINSAVGAFEEDRI